LVIPRTPTVGLALGAALSLAIWLVVGLSTDAHAPESTSALLSDGGGAGWSGALGDPMDEELSSPLILLVAHAASPADSVDAELDASEGSTPVALWHQMEKWPGGVIRDESGGLASIFGFTAPVARDVLQPVTRERSLPSVYRPPDLVLAPGARSGALVRSVAVADLQDLLAAARQANVQLAPVSGFRSYATQAALFEQRVREFRVRLGSDVDVEEVRQRANMGTALPGQSQHQLGTAIDFSTPGLGYRVTPAFAETTEGQWLREHAAAFGFVFPYTLEARALTGYIAEPWHVRWVGRGLAAFLVSEGYLASTEVTVDSYLEAIEAYSEERR
jgi:zinc D-Ala-D-Ala carboxypeptidase